MDKGKSECQNFLLASINCKSKNSKRNDDDSVDAS